MKVYTTTNTALGTGCTWDDVYKAGEEIGLHVAEAVRNAGFDADGPALIRVTVERVWTNGEAKPVDEWLVTEGEMTAEEFAALPEFQGY